MLPEENDKQLSSAAATATDTLVCESVGILALKQLQLLHSGNTVQPAEILVQEADAAKEEGASSLLAAARKDGVHRYWPVEAVYGPIPSKSTNPHPPKTKTLAVVPGCEQEIEIQARLEEESETLRNARMEALRRMGATLNAPEAVAAKMEVEHLRTEEEAAAEVEASTAALRVARLQSEMHVTELTTDTQAESLEQHQMLDETEMRQVVPEVALPFVEDEMHACGQWSEALNPCRVMQESCSLPLEASHFDPISVEQSAFSFSPEATHVVRNLMELESYSNARPSIAEGPTRASPKKKRRASLSIRLRSSTKNGMCVCVSVVHACCAREISCKKDLS
jgi:hypothetical protein